MRKQQSGFTLVEIAIVLVIIGLLLGGVLKGQELINSAKVKNFANDFRNIPLYIYGYQDRFKAIPGDDAAVVAHLGAAATLATTPAGTVGNGAINGNWDTVTLTDESMLFWATYAARSPRRRRRSRRHRQPTTPSAWAFEARGGASPTALNGRQKAIPAPRQRAADVPATVCPRPPLARRRRAKALRPAGGAGASVILARS